MAFHKIKVLIEEEALFNEEESVEEFAAHFYYTRYTKVKGVPMESFESLLQDFQKKLESLDETVGHSIWSMNWYVLYDETGKPRPLEYNERIALDKLVFDYDRKSSSCYHLCLPPDNSTKILLALAKFANSFVQEEQE